MRQIISKLSVSETNLMYPYLINNVSIGIIRALKNKKVKSNKFAYIELNRLYDEIMNIPSPFNPDRIKTSNQLIAVEIGNEALEIILELN